MNITLNDLEIMENEMVVNSGRMSIDSSRSQQASITTARAALNSGSLHFARTASTTTASRQKELQGLRERNAALESAILERDHLVVVKPSADP